MTQNSNRTETQVNDFRIEKLEDRDAPKIAGGGLDDTKLEKGGGRPSKA